MDVALQTRAEQLANEIADQAKTIEDLNGLMRQMMKAGLERMLNTEMDVHLGRKVCGPLEKIKESASEPLPASGPTQAAASGRKSANRRNGRSRKTLRADLGENEGAKFWLGVMTDMKNRGLRDIFVACIDGLSGFAEAIHAAYPQTKVQLCIVHLVRAALRYVSQQDSKAVIADLKTIYAAATALEAEQALDSFAQVWDGKYPTIAKMWRAKWTDIIAIFDFPPPIRKAIYTTNAIESVNSVIRKFTRNRKIYPNEDSAVKLVFMAIREAAKKWTMPIHHWKEALNHFAIMFEDRMPMSLSK
jgi:putative transposase